MSVCPCKCFFSCLLEKFLLVLYDLAQKSALQERLLLDLLYILCIPLLLHLTHYPAVICLHVQMSLPLVCKLLEVRDPISLTFVCLVYSTKPGEKEREEAEWSIQLINGGWIKK